MMPSLRSFVVALAVSYLATIVGCSSLKVRTDFDSEVDFARYGTYAWLAEPMRAEAPTSPADELVNPFARNSLLDKRVRRAVDHALVARGYREGDAPAFRVQYHVMLESKTKIRSYPGGAYYDGFLRHGYYYGAGWGGTYSYDYKEGTLIVDVIDARSDRLAWRGWAIGKRRDFYYDEAAVDEAVFAILSKFPPGSSGQPASDEAYRRERTE